MSVIDINALLGEKPDDPPSGSDLEYDPAFQAMERASEPSPERQMGDAVIPAEPPQWKEVRRLAGEVLQRSHDLRAAACLARALVRTDGYEGLADGLELIHGLLAQYWESVHPLLDPEDDLDPTMRVNVLESLSDYDATVSGVRHATLVAHPVLGRFGLHQMELAHSGAEGGGAEAETPDPAAIDAAFLDADTAALEATRAQVARCVDAVRQIETVCAERVGIASGPDLSRLQQSLDEAARVMVEQLARRGIGEEGGGDQAAGPAAAVADAAAGPALSGEVRNRQDVIRALDSVCSYYERTEPSSPIPLLLRRAKRLVSMDFMELVRDLAPSGVSELEVIRGSADGDD